MIETIEGLRNKLFKWKSLETNGLKISLGKTKDMVSSGITQDGLSKGKVVPCWVCSMRVMANSVLCIRSGKWIHGRCARVKRVIPKI